MARSDCDGNVIHQLPKAAAPCDFERDLSIVAAKNIPLALVEAQATLPSVRRNSERYLGETSTPTAKPTLGSAISSEIDLTFPVLHIVSTDEACAEGF